MIVALLAEKGDTGTTTLATNLAGMRTGTAARHRVLLVDSDGRGSSHFWGADTIFPQAPTAGLDRAVRRGVRLTDSDRRLQVRRRGDRHRRRRARQNVSLDFQVLYADSGWGAERPFPILNIIAPPSPHRPRVDPRIRLQQRIA